MTMRPLNHNSRLILARKARTATGDVHSVRLTEDIGAFMSVLVHHLDSKVRTLTRLLPADARVIRRGHAQASDAVRALIRDAEVHSRPGCRCAARAEKFLALLTIQTLDERVALHRAACGASNRRWLP